jgi:hypothetical protein
MLTPFPDPPVRASIAPPLAIDKLPAVTEMLPLLLLPDVAADIPPMPAIDRVPAVMVMFPGVPPCIGDPLTVFASERIPELPLMES